MEPEGSDVTVPLDGRCGAEKELPRLLEGLLGQGGCRGLWAPVSVLRGSGHGSSVWSMQGS